MSDELSSASGTEVVQAEVTPTQESVAEVISEPVEQTTEQTEVAAETKQEKQERLFNEKEMRRISAKEKRAGYESGRQEAMAEIERQRQEQAQKPVDPAYETEEQRIARLVDAQLAEKVRAHRYQEDLSKATQMEKNFLSKMEDARDRYPDFDEKYKALNIENHPKLILWMDELDNVGDIVYDMASNPEKVATVMMLANSNFPDLAKQKLKDLSASIKMNENARKQPQAPDPLTQVKPTSVGIDSGLNTVSDFRKASWLRG